MWARVAGSTPSSALLALLFATLAASTAWSGETRVAISGYDPVAYFADGEPIRGQAQFEYVWHDARWRFASAAHRDLFIADPEHYAPQYDGYCARGVAGVSFAAPHKDTVDPEAWAIVDGKLYLTHTRRSLEAWRQDAAKNIKQADENWSVVRNQVDPAVIGPPCRAQPPSVIVSPKGGGRRVLIGGQLALDEGGNVIGKGDMRAQFEQVGKNIQACLQAAGTNASEIILTRAYVTDAAAFSKSVDLQRRYLGPESATSAVIEVPKVTAGPEFLVEIEAVAAAE